MQGSRLGRRDGINLTSTSSPRTVVQASADEEDARAGQGRVGGERSTMLPPEVCVAEGDREAAEEGRWRGSSGDVSGRGRQPGRQPDVNTSTA